MSTTIGNCCWAFLLSGAGFCVIVGARNGALMLELMPAMLELLDVRWGIEDAALSVIASTDAMWRLRSTYLNEHHRDCKILATLQQPSKCAPFTFIGVKRAYRKLPAFV